MKIAYSEEARSTLFEISDFVDRVNTEGAGERWTKRFTAWLQSFAISNVSYSFCNDEYFASLNLSCINYNDGIVAFKIEDDLFVVYEIVRGSLLT